MNQGFTLMDSDKSVLKQVQLTDGDSSSSMESEVTMSENEIVELRRRIFNEVNSPRTRKAKQRYKMSALQKKEENRKRTQLRHARKCARNNSRWESVQVGEYILGSGRYVRTCP